jgi:hypothetical protein
MSHSASIPSAALCYVGPCIRPIAKLCYLRQRLCSKRYIDGRCLLFAPVKHCPRYASTLY